MDTVWTTVVAAVLGSWLAASVVHQVSPRWWAGRIRSDVFGLLPRWNFFAPRPVHDDVHVVFRECRGGQWSAWQALTPAASPRAIRWIWNPQRYTRKAATDLVNGLRRSMARFDATPRAVLLSSSYVGLLGWVMGQPGAADVTHRQFAVLTSSGFGPEQKLNVLFVSEPHSRDA